jgi:hypothetical protein
LPCVPEHGHGEVGPAGQDAKEGDGRRAHPRTDSR